MFNIAVSKRCYGSTLPSLNVVTAQHFHSSSFTIITTQVGYRSLCLCLKTLKVLRCNGVQHSFLRQRSTFETKIIKCDEPIPRSRTKGEIEAVLHGLLTMVHTQRSICHVHEYMMCRPEYVKFVGQYILTGPNDRLLSLWSLFWDWKI